MSNTHAPLPTNSLQYKRILLIKPSSLGDIVHALPVLRALRHRYPDARIDWLVNTGFAQLLLDHSDITNVITFDRKRFAGVGVNLSASKEFFRFIRQLRAVRYDCVIDLQGLFRSGFLAWTTGAAMRLGFSQAREGAWIFYNRRVRVNANDHAVDRNRQLVQALIGQVDEITFPLSIGSADTEAIRAMLNESCVDMDQHFMVIVPGARWETKMWPAKFFAETIDTLTTNMGIPIVLVGGPDDVQRCRAIAEMCQHKPVNLAGRTSVRQFAAILKKASLVMCHDSAAMHFAVAFHRPLIAILGPTNPDRTGPYRRSESVVRLDLACSPCYLRDLASCRHAHRCMEELAVSTVVSAAARALDKKVVSTHVGLS